MNAHLARAVVAELLGEVKFPSIGSSLILAARQDADACRNFVLVDLWGIFERRGGRLLDVDVEAVISSGSGFLHSLPGDHALASGRLKCHVSVAAGPVLLVLRNADFAIDDEVARAFLFTVKTVREHFAYAPAPSRLLCPVLLCSSVERARRLVTRSEAFYCSPVCTLGQLHG